MQAKRHNYIRINMLMKRDLSNMLGSTLNENPKLQAKNITSKTYELNFSLMHLSRKLHNNPQKKEDIKKLMKVRKYNYGWDLYLGIRKIEVDC